MKFILGLFMLIGTLGIQSQILEPVKWTTSVSDEGDGLYTLLFTADIEEHWHLYSQHLDTTKLGPWPTTFEYGSNAGYKLIGETIEPDPMVGYDPNFDMDLGYFETQAQFTQKVRLQAAGAEIPVTINFMACDDKQCIFPDPAELKFTIGDAVVGDSAAVPSGILEPVKWEFTSFKTGENTFELNFKALIDEHWHLYSQHLESEFGPVPTSFTFEESTDYEIVGETKEGDPHKSWDPNFEMELSYFDTEAIFTQEIVWKEDQVGAVKGYLTFMTCDDSKCLPPDDIYFELDLSQAQFQTATGEATKGDKKGMWTIFFIAFLSGFAALLTPCVFPMIPLTVSFFTKQSKTRAKGITNAIIYGLFIVIIYVALGVFVSAIFGADALNNLATNVWFNLAFFVLLVVFAASFLGAFEITLPNSWVNKADNASNKGGLLGIFFMAFTLALVSFSCTGPIVGTLLVEAAAGGSYFGPIVGMLGFSLAIALPFALFAAFPGWMNSLPQSGGWLNSVKVVLGFLELALAFKFLSNADLVVQAHLLQRELFIAIWIIIFALLTLYLLGFLKLSHDSPLPHISVTRLFMAIITGMFTIYMIPGLWGAPLKIINAFPPPMHYSESPQGVGFIGGGSGGGPGSSGHAAVAGMHNGPQGIQVFHDYDEGLAHAKKVGLPVMLDFTGWACVNCRKMEEEVWSDGAIKKSLSEDVVLISLYVDEQTPLPKSEQYETELHGKTKKIRKVGDKWKLLQEKRYQINSQPYYVLIDHDEKNLTEAANYQDHGSVSVFAEWLERGLSNFDKSKQD